MAVNYTDWLLKIQIINIHTYNIKTYIQNYKKYKKTYK